MAVFESPWAEQSSGLAVEQPTNLANILQKGLAGADYDYVPQLTISPVAEATMTICAPMQGLPTRYLQHVRVADLYWQFLAAWDEQQLHGFLTFQSPPCFRTFSRRWKFWHDHKWLRIRKSSQHAQCQTCFELLRAINSTAGSWGSKMQAARDLRAHYTHQYLDRCIYWSLRLMSQTFKDVLTIIIDGMDKAKFAWPHWPFDRIPKGMEKFIRPKMVFTAAMAHGWCMCLFMTSEFVDHGSSLWCELICQVLEEVWKISKSTGRRFPRHLVVVSDNTTGFAKNQYSMKFLALLVAAYKFVTANLLFLTVGHTHEDIDQLFAVVLWLMLRKKSWETPEEILKFIADGLRERAGQKGEVLVAVQLSAVRDFKSWLGRLGLKTDNCYMTRQGQEAPHSFSMKLGSLLTQSERAMILQVPGAPPFEPNAVYCCVKMFLRSTQLQQAPVYQMPVARAARIQTMSPTQILRKELSESDIKQHLSLAGVCTELDMQSAAAALRSQVYSRRYFLPSLTWLETFQQPDLLDVAAARTLNPYFPHLPETSWKMVAKLDG